MFYHATSPPFPVVASCHPTLPHPNANHATPPCSTIESQVALLSVHHRKHHRDTPRSNQITPQSLTNKKKTPKHHLLGQIHMHATTSEALHTRMIARKVAYKEGWGRCTMGLTRKGGRSRKVWHDTVMVKVGFRWRQRWGLMALCGLVWLCGFEAEIA